MQQDRHIKELTPEQALAILDDTCSRVAMSRKEHALLQQAVAVLRAMIESTRKGNDGKQHEDG